MQERHEDMKGGEEMESEEDKEGGEAEGDRDRETPRGATVEVTRLGGDAPPRWKTRTSRDST